MLFFSSLSSDDIEERCLFDISEGLIVDPNDSKVHEPSNIKFDNSDVTLSTNSINTTNQITHQHVNNHGPINQQNYSGQTIHGNQSNITPNFNTIIQTTSQPFVQNNSNTLVQNNNNLIQPINLVNFNNVSIDSLQSFLASQNNLLYLSQPSSTSANPSTTTTTVTTTTTTTSNQNSFNESEQHQISIRPKPSLIPQPPPPPPPSSSLHQESHSLLPKIKSEHFDYPTRQLSTSSNSETTNLLDNDLNHKHPRPIRPKPSSRINSLQIYPPVIHNDSKPITTNVLTPSLLTNTNPSSTVSILSPSTSFEEHHHPDLSSPQLLQSKSLDLSIPPTNNLLTTMKKPTKNPSRNRKKPQPPPLTPVSSTSSIVPSTNSSLVPIAPNPGRPLAPAPLNVQRIVASSTTTTTTSTTTNKRSTSTKKRNSKSLVQYHSESVLQTNSSPSNSFAESISGLMQNFDQELIASNFLSQPQTTNILSNEPTRTPTPLTTATSNINLIRTLDTIDVRQIVNTTIQRTDSSYPNLSTMDEFHDRLDHETNQTIQDYNVDNEQISSFINEEEMNFVEMNFDENTFLKQFDLDDSQLKLNINSEQNLFTSLLTSNHHHHQQQQQHLPNPLEQPTPPPSIPPPPLPPPSYPGSSLINNNVFTTIVPLNSQQTSSLNSSYNTSRCLPEEGVQLTARHLEPSQVATYESVKYQDILDDLVTVTDQDVLSHVQAAVADNETTDFSFALLAATNEIIKTTEIEVAEETASTFVDLQYFYPIEQEQELLQKQLEQCEEEPSVPEQVTEGEDEEDDDEEDEEDILPSNDSPKSVENDNPTITDLTSILQISQARSPTPVKEPSSLPLPAPTIDFNDLLPPEPSPPPPAIDYNALLPPKSPPVPTPKIDYNTLLPPKSSPAPTSKIDFNTLLPPKSSPAPTSKIDYNNLLPPKSSPVPTPKVDYNSLLPPKSSPAPTPKIDFNTLLPPDPPPPPPVVELPSVLETTSRKACIIFEPILSPAQDELVLESGCVPDPSIEKPTNSLDNTQIEELLNDPQENHLDEFFREDSPVHRDEHVENENQTSPSAIIPDDNLDDLVEETGEPTEKILEKNFLHYQKVYHESQKKKPKEQYSPIPSVKLKLNSIYPKQKKKRKHSPSPPPPPPLPPLDENIRPPLKIKIRTKLPSPPPAIREPSPPPPPPPLPKIKIRKPIKKVKRSKKSPPSLDDQLETEAKLSSKTEYAGLTRFEQSLAQRYHQQTSPDTRIPPTPGENEDVNLIPHQQDTPPTTANASSPVNANKKLSHLFNYDGDSLNTNTYITPPPEIEANIHQQHKTSSQPIGQSPKKSKKTHQNSSNKKDFYSSGKRPQILPAPPPTQPAIHMDPYAQSFHHFDPRTSPFFNFPFANPFLNPHSTPSHFHQNPMKYHYPTHQPPFSYHPHLQRQQQYNNPNYMRKFFVLLKE